MYVLEKQTESIVVAMRKYMEHILMKYHTKQTRIHKEIQKNLTGQPNRQLNTDLITERFE
jgi:hypothetical protein